MYSRLKRGGRDLRKVTEIVKDGGNKGSSCGNGTKERERETKELEGGSCGMQNSRK